MNDDDGRDDDGINIIPPVRCHAEPHYSIRIKRYVRIIILYVFTIKRYDSDADPDNVILMALWSLALKICLSSTY